MTPTAKSQGHPRSAGRGAVEGAVLGFTVVMFRLVRLWLGGADAGEFHDHLGEVGLYSLIVIAVMAYIFGAGRAISGGWVGSLAGAAALGLGGLGIGVRVLPPNGDALIGLLALLGAGGLVGAPLGAIVERLMWQRRSQQLDGQTPVGDGPE